VILSVYLLKILCGMKKSEHNGLTLFTFHQLENQQGIMHFVTGRSGGFSNGPFKSLNTGFHSGDRFEDVLNNRRKIAGVLNLDISQFTFARQTHSANVAIVGKEQKGKGGARPDDAIDNTDALITQERGICICVQTADCVPLLVYDPEKHVVAAIHAGWRGTLRKVAEHTIHTLIETFGCHPADLLVGIGPSNGPCCYEVGEDVREEAIAALGSVNGIILPGASRGKYIFDQWQANKQQLLECGIKEENIEITTYCSQTHHDLFFSSRAGKGVTGRTTSGIMLLE
jgi:polyphenol oxidase